MTLLAPHSPTCFTTGCATTLDMFVVHPRLTLVIPGLATTDRSHQIATHLPVSISIRTLVRDDKVKVLKAPEQKCDGNSVFGPHKLAAAGWDQWSEFKHLVALGLWAATHTSDSGCKANADAVLQVLNKRTSPAQEELADHSGLEATPLPTFQTKDLKITALVKQHTGARNRAADQEEWLWRRLTELRSTISAGRNPNEGLKVFPSESKVRPTSSCGKRPWDGYDPFMPGRGLLAMRSVWTNWLI